MFPRVLKCFPLDISLEHCIFGYGIAKASKRKEDGGGVFRPTKKQILQSKTPILVLHSKTPSRGL